MPACSLPPRSQQGHRHSAVYAATRKVDRVLWQAVSRFSPTRHARCTLSQPSKGRFILTVSLACDDWLVGDGFVGVALYHSPEIIASRILLAVYGYPGPTVVRSTVDRKADPEVCRLPKLKSSPVVF